MQITEANARLIIVVAGLMMMVLLTIVAAFKVNVKLLIAGLKEDIINTYVPEIMKPRALPSEKVKTTEPETTEEGPKEDQP